MSLLVRSVGVSAPPSVPALALSRLAPPPPSRVHHTGVLRAPCLVSPPAMETPLPPVSYEDEHEHATTEKMKMDERRALNHNTGLLHTHRAARNSRGGKKTWMFEKLASWNLKVGMEDTTTSTPTGNGRMRGRMGDREWARMKWKFPMGVKDGAFFPRIF